MESADARDDSGDSKSLGFSPKLSLRRNLSSSFVGLRHKSPYVQRTPTHSPHNSSSKSPKRESSVQKRGRSPLKSWNLNQNKENEKPNSQLNEDGKRRKLMEIAKSIEEKAMEFQESFEYSQYFSKEKNTMKGKSTQPTPKDKFNMDAIYLNCSTRLVKKIEQSPLRKHEKPQRTLGSFNEKQKSPLKRKNSLFKN